MNGKQGEKVDHLTREERWRRYPAIPGNPEGTGQYLLEVGNGRLYLDALKQDGDLHKRMMAHEGLRGGADWEGK